MDGHHGGLDISSKIDLFMKNKQYYEAEQLFMTQVNRAVSQKQFATAHSLAERGVKAMLEVAQSHVDAIAPSSVKSSALAAGELGKLYLSALRRSDVSAVSAETVDQILGLAAAMDAVAAAAVAKGDAYAAKDEDGSASSLFAVRRVEDLFLREAQEFVTDTADRTGDATVPPFGSPRIEAARARVAAALRGPAAAQPHFARAGEPAAHAAALLAWCKEEENDVKSAWPAAQSLRAALYAVALCLEQEDLRGAHAIAAAAAGAYPDASLDDAAAAVRLFTAQLLELAQRGPAAAPLFEALRKAGSRKKVFPAADDEKFPLAGAVTRVGAKLFGIEPPKGMLEELLGISNIGDLLRK